MRSDGFVSFQIYLRECKCIQIGKNNMLSDNNRDSTNTFNTCFIFIFLFCLLGHLWILFDKMFSLAAEKEPGFHLVLTLDPGFSTVALEIPYLLFIFIIIKFSFNNTIFFYFKVISQSFVSNYFPYQIVIIQRKEFLCV